MSPNLPPTKRRFTIIYALARVSSSAYLHEWDHHVAYVTAEYLDEAIERCRQDTLPGFVFQLVVAFWDHADRCAKGDSVVIHDFSAPEVSS